MTLLSAVALLQLLPAMAGLVLYSRLSDPLRSLTWLFVAGAVAEIMNKITIASIGTNMPVIYLYSVAEVWLLVVFITRVSYMRFSLFYVIVCLFITSVCLTEFTLHPMEMPSVTRALICIVAAWFFAVIIWRVSGGLLVEGSLYTIVGLLLVYYISTGVFFAVFNYLTKPAMTFAAIVIMVINGVLNAVYPYFIWKSTKSSSLA